MGVDHAHDVVLLQPVELGQDLALEVRFVEPQHQKLYSSDYCHVPLLSQLRSSIADAKGEDIARRPDSPGDTWADYCLAIAIASRSSGEIR